MQNDWRPVVAGIAFLTLLGWCGYLNNTLKIEGRRDGYLSPNYDRQTTVTLANPIRKLVFTGFGHPEQVLVSGDVATVRIVYHYKPMVRP